MSEWGRHERWNDGTRRLNVGCGEWPLPYWINLDSDPEIEADVHAVVPPLPFPDADFDEVYAGHFLEHLTYDDGQAFLKECWRVLKPFGLLTVVVPDTHEVMTRYLAHSVDAVPTMIGDEVRYLPVADLDAVCALFLYSTVQKSQHKWSYDSQTLYRALLRAGFPSDMVPVDRYKDPRLGTGQWYQCGWRVRKQFEPREADDDGTGDGA